jgi:hypothetical protein
LFHEHIEEELSVDFDLEETTAICGCRGDEVGAKVLRGLAHIGNESGRLGLKLLFEYGFSRA